MSILNLAPKYEHKNDVYIIYAVEFLGDFPHSICVLMLADLSIDIKKEEFFRYNLNIFFSGEESVLITFQLF